MDIVTRAKNICVTPNTEWQVIAGESTPPAALITEYAVPLAAIGAVCGLIGGSLIGRTLPFVGGTYRVPLMSGIVLAVFTFAMAIAGVFILSLIINALAPTFGGEQNSLQAMKVAVYSYTPAWIAGALQILPMLSLLAVIGALYGLYLLYLGLPRLMKCPQEKAVGYTVIVVVCAIVITMVVGAIGGIIAGGAAMGAGALSSGVTPSRSNEVQFDKDSTLGKLQALGNKMEESTKKMEAAQKSGDANAQAAAAFEGLGTLLGGGKRVEPVAIDQLKPFIPETFAGLPKASSNAEKSGMAGIMVSKAEATYRNESGKNARLEVTDTGGVSGMLGLASWVGVEGEKDTDSSSERTQKMNGRLVHEKVSKTGGENEFALVIADRFVVGATGNVGLDELKAAVSSIDLGKLEAMKAAGVQK
jgi:Yip1-like protein